MRDEHEQSIAVDGIEAEIVLRFRLATNGIVAITNCGSKPVVMTGAGSFN